MPIDTEDVLAVGAPFTTAGAGTKTRLIDEPEMNLGKTLVNRLPELQVDTWYWGKAPGSETNYGIDPPAVLGTLTIAGPNGFFQSLTATQRSRHYDVAPGTYTVCMKAPSGFRTSNFTSSQCVIRDLTSYNISRYVDVNFYCLQQLRDPGGGAAPARCGTRGAP